MRRSISEQWSDSIVPMIGRTEIACRGSDSIVSVARVLRNGRAGFIEWLDRSRGPCSRSVSPGGDPVAAVNGFTATPQYKCDCRVLSFCERPAVNRRPVTSRDRTYITGEVNCPYDCSVQFASLEKLNCHLKCAIRPESPPQEIVKLGPPTSNSRARRLATIPPRLPITRFGVSGGPAASFN